MTIRRAFMCDLCKDEIRESDDLHGVGIIWEFQKIKSTPLAGSEHHLCGYCCRQLYAALSEMKFPPVVTPVGGKARVSPTSV